MEQNYDQYLEGPRPHPYLHEPLLYITNLPPYVSDENLAMAFVNCGPFRPKIPRDGSHNMLSGTIEFKFLDRAEKALATLQGRNIPETAVPLVLSSYPPTHPPTPLPPPSALPRLVKQLPPGYTDGMLYDLFRPYGALSSVRTQTQLGPDTGIVEFWNEEDAIVAEDTLHCAEVEGQNIAVQVYQPRRAPVEFNIAAPTFVPSGFYQPQYPTQYSPPRQTPYSPVHSPLQTPSSPFIHGPGQQVQLAPMGNSHSGLIDPCNLFVKNLSPEIDSKELFAHFTNFGQIVSARVMRNEAGESRGFGFVSYHQPEHATAALQTMNGITLGSKQIVVRLHEPKQLRQEKLAHRFGQGHNGHPRRNSSGATSPAASEAGESYSAWNSPRMYPSNLGSPALSPKPQHHHFDRSTPDRGRRGSGSYYTAALNGSLGIPMNYNSLSALSPVVRKEVLSGELSRRIKSFESFDDKAVEGLVEGLVSLSLSNVLQILEEPPKLKEKVDDYKSKHPELQALGLPTPEAHLVVDPPTRPLSEPASQDSRGTDNNNLATASAPEHPSTPVSISQSLLTPPRTSSPAGSVPPSMSERDRILAAINKLETTNQSELTDLIMSLPKRERAMCLFNVEVLRAKLVDAKAVLESEGEGDAGGDAVSTKSAPPAQKPQQQQQQQQPSTPMVKKSGVANVPLTPESPAPPLTTASTTPTTSTGPTYTVASLSKLPAAEIVRLVHSGNGTGLPLPKADPLVIKTTDEFIDALLDRPIQAQKQAVGEKLFKVIKSFGIKQAPKITIQLLDQEDLRALAHLMNSYPLVLKEKALALITTK